MRLYIHDAASYMNTLANSLAKDPASLDGWRCLRIAPSRHAPLGIADILRVREAHKDLDCDVVLCDDQDIIIISRELGVDAMQKLVGAFTAVMDGDAPEVTRYDMFRQWREIRAMLLIKTHGKAMRILPDIQPAVFGEIDSLQDIFAEAKKLRKVRQPQHVMIVEDDALTRRIVAGSLKDNFAVITAHDAQEAVANYMMFAPDIVFLDIGLPDESGFAVLRQIMESDPDAYVVMFSANSYLDNITKALTAGASGFLAKPFNREKLRYYISGSALHYQKSYA